jgi:hypothetical protein
MRAIRMLKKSLFSPAQPRRVSARRGWAGEKSGLFEHPEPVLTSAPYGGFQRYFVYKSSFSAACYTAERSKPARSQEKEGHARIALVKCCCVACYFINITSVAFTTAVT